MNAERSHPLLAGEHVERVGAAAGVPGRARRSRAPPSSRGTARSRRRTATRRRGPRRRTRRSAHIRLGPIRSATLPSGTAKKNDAPSPTVRPTPDLGRGQPDDLGEEHRAAGEEGALADREQDRLQRELARQGRARGSGRRASVGVRGGHRRGFFQRSTSVRRVDFRSRHAARGRGRRRPGLAGRAGGAGAARRRDVGLDGHPQAGACSPATRCWRRSPRRSAGWAGPGRWLLALPASYVAGVQVVCRSLVAGHEPVLLDEAAGRRVGRLRLARARPSCTGCSTTRRPWPRCAALHTSCSAAGRSTRPCARGPRRPGLRVVATYGSAETAGGCVYDGYPLDGVGVASATTAGSGSPGRPCSTGTTATRS